MLSSGRLRPHEGLVDLLPTDRCEAEPITSVHRTARAGREQQASAKKLRPAEIADAIVGALKVDSRGFIPEFSVFATNPF